jgi:hypothetical protein
MFAASDVEALRTPVGSVAGTCGISRFIKEELIADGHTKPLVPFPVTAKFKRKNQSNAGLHRGRTVDTEFRQSIDNPRTCSKDAKKIHAALRDAGITAVSAQHRVLTKENMLTTLLDGVGVTTSNNKKLWAIEIKTSMLQFRTGAYESYALTACRRTPCLRSTPMLANNERNRHLLQAAYGAIGLSRQVGRPCQAIVVVLCVDACITIRVPASYLIETLFMRLPRVAVKVNITPTKKPTTCKQVCDTIPWSATATKALSKYGLTIKRPLLAKGIYNVVNASGNIVGVVASIPKWGTMGSTGRTRVARHFRAATATKGRQGTRTPYVISSLTPGGRLQLSVAGSVL